MNTKTIRHEVVDTYTGEGLGIPSPMLLQAFWEADDRPQQAWQKFPPQWRYVSPDEQEEAEASGTIRTVSIRTNW